jgi:hypothetical protein
VDATAASVMLAAVDTLQASFLSRISGALVTYQGNMHVYLCAVYSPDASEDDDWMTTERKRMRFGSANARLCSCQSRARYWDGRACVALRARENNMIKVTARRLITPTDLLSAPSDNYETGIGRGTNNEGEKEEEEEDGVVVQRFWSDTLLLFSPHLELAIKH